MNYSNVASTIRNKVSQLTQKISSVGDISFADIWSGDAYSNLTSNLDSSISNINMQIDKSLKYADALDKLQEYKDNKNSIDLLKEQLSNLLDTDENVKKKKELNDKISTLKTANNRLENQIISLLSTIYSVETEFTIVNYEVSQTDYSEYVVDLYDFLNLFNSGSLTKLTDGGSGSSLYDYYSKEEVENRINEIKSQYTGRAAAVNCALGIMSMAADVGKKLDYDFGGGHTSVTSLDAIATGADCSSFASWAINQGTTGTFNTQTTAGLVSAGTKTSFENAQQGDILVYNNGSSGHVVMIVDNDPETQQFLVAEAANSKTGVVMKTRSYASLSGKYQARDLSSIYNM